MLLIWIIFSLNLLNSLYAKLAEDGSQFFGQCNYNIISNDLSNYTECEVSLYNSNKNFSFQGLLNLRQPPTFMCNPLIEKYPKSKGMIAVALRGNCLFENKTRTAEILGYKGLIVINSDNNLFPISYSPDFRTNLPVFMVKKSFNEIIDEFKNDDIYVHFSYGNKR